MRSQSICLALVLLCPSASAQRVQTGGLNDQHILYHPLISTNLPQETLRGFLGLSNQPRMQADSVRGTHMQSPLLDGKFNPNGIQKGLGSLRRVSSPQSQIYVIDTAIVRSTTDTTRHLYSFNANAKRTLDLTQRLEGDVWVDTLRQSNTYDAGNNMLSDLREYWSNGQWVISFRETNTYDANGRRTSLSSEQWSNGQLVGNWRYTETYDASGNVLSVASEHWTNGQLATSDRCTYAYDANGNVIFELTEYWSTGRWYNSGRYTGTYDTLGNELTGLWEEWSNGQWVNSLRWTETHNADGNMLCHYTERWSHGQWEASQRMTCTYDTHGRTLTELNEWWSRGEWETVQRWTYTYDASGNLLSRLYEEWSTGQFYGQRFTYTYDPDGKLLTALREQWENSGWVNSQRSTRAYDAQANLTSWWGYVWRDFTWTPANHYWVDCVVTDSAGNTYGFSFCYNFSLTYRAILTGVSFDKSELPICFSLSQNYPNPFNPSTTIKYELPTVAEVRLSVFDMLGREVSVLVNERRDAGVHEVKFDGAGLSSGVYFYRLQAGDFVQTKRLVLLR